MKKTLLNIMRISGTFATFRLVNRSKVLVLMYHRFSNQEDAERTSARAFREHLNYLTSHYQIVSLSKVAELIAERKHIPSGLAVITIDDGYRDAYDIAYPILREFNVPACLFVVTDFIEEKSWLWTDKIKYATSRSNVRWLEVFLNDCLIRIELTDAQSRKSAANYINSLLKTMPNESKEQVILKIATSLGVDLPEKTTEDYQPLTWGEVRELNAAGIEIGSHTVTHPILTRVDHNQLRFELHESKLHLEARLRSNVNLFCYPNGNHDDQVAREVKRAGYKCAVTTNYGLNGNTVEMLRLRRISAESDFSRFLQSTSGFEEAKMKIRSLRFPLTSKNSIVSLQARGR